MTTELLQEFYILATLLNFSRAAENLFISQSVLSRHMKALEGELSVRLFIRDTHHVSLTEEGRLLLREAGPLIRKAERAESVTADPRVRTEGRITIIYQEQTLCTPVMNSIQGFRQRYPNIALDFHLIPSAPGISVIGDADYLLSPCDFTDQLPDGMEWRLLHKQQALLAYPPRHRFGDLQSISLQDLKGEHLFVPYANEMFGPYARNALLASRRSAGVVSRIHVPSPAEGLLRVEFGECMMIIPHHLRRQIYGSTRTLTILDPECIFPVYLYYRSGCSSAGIFLADV